MSKSARGWVLVLLLVGVAGGGFVGWRLGLWDWILGRKGSPDPKAVESVTGVDAVLNHKALGLKKDDAAGRDAVKRELSDADPKAVAAELDKAADGKEYDAWRSLPKDERADLALLAPKELTAQKVRALRAYLAEWRTQLAALRKAAQDAGLATVPKDDAKKKFADLPTLGWLSVLARPPEDGQYDFGKLPAPGGGSALPFFSKDDAATATALRQLFGERQGNFSDLVKAFASNVLKGPDAGLAERLKLAAELTPPLDESILGEIQKGVMGKVIPGVDAAGLQPCSNALDKLTRAFRNKTLDPTALSGK